MHLLRLRHQPDVDHADLLFSGELQKHPRLKFMLAEGGIGWFPYIRERIGPGLGAAPLVPGDRQGGRPSDLFRKHFWGCYIEDEYGIENRHEIGIDRIASRSTSRTRTPTGPTAASASPSRWPTSPTTRRRGSSNERP